MKKILIVDDDPKIVRVVETELRKNNFEVIAAGDGEHGLAQARLHQPDLVLLDRLMPKMHGHKMLELMRQDEVLAHTPVIMLTADKDADAIVDSMVDGAAVGYVVKPFEMDDLIKNVKRVLQCE